MAGGNRRSPPGGDGGGGNGKARGSSGSSREEVGGPHGGGSGAAKTAAGGSVGLALSAEAPASSGIHRGALISALQAKLGGADGGGVSDGSAPAKETPSRGRSSAKSSRLRSGGKGGRDRSRSSDFVFKAGGTDAGRRDAYLTKGGAAAVVSGLEATHAETSSAAEIFTSMADTAPMAGGETDGTVPRCHPKCFYGICTFEPDEEEVEELHSGKTTDFECDMFEGMICSGNLEVCGRSDDDGIAASAGKPVTARREDICGQGARGNVPVDSSRPGAEANKGHGVWDGNSPRGVCGIAAEDCGPQNGTKEPRRRDQAWKGREFDVFEEEECIEEVIMEDESVLLDRNAVQANVSRLDCALVGKTLGRRLPFHFLCNELKRRWAQAGDCQVIAVAEDCFIAVFGSAEARDLILRGGPWVVAGNLIGLDRWHPGFSYKSMEGFSSPIWVRLPNLPLTCWDKKNIGRIAMKIGKPLWIDSQTKVWGRSEYARVCVRTDLSKKLQEGTWIQGDGFRFYQRFEYEGISLLCFNCGRVGHKIGSCPERPRVEVDVGPEALKTPQERREGKAPEELSKSSAETAVGGLPRGTAELPNTNMRPTRNLSKPRIPDPLRNVAESSWGHGPWTLVENRRKKRPTPRAEGGGPNRPFGGGDRNSSWHGNRRRDNGGSWVGLPGKGGAGSSTDLVLQGKTPAVVNSRPPVQGRTVSPPPWAVGQQPAQALGDQNGLDNALCLVPFAPMETDRAAKKKRKDRNGDLDGGGDASPSGC